MNLITKLFTISSYVFCSEYNTTQESSGIHKQESYVFNDSRLDFLYLKHFDKDELKIEDVKRAFCLDVKLGEAYDKFVITMLESIYENHECSYIYLLLLKKLVYKLNSESSNNDKSMRIKDVEFLVDEGKSIDDDSKFRIANLIIFFFVRVKDDGSLSKIYFEDFMLTYFKPPTTFSHQNNEITKTSSFSFSSNKKADIVVVPDSDWHKIKERGDYVRSIGRIFEMLRSVANFIFGNEITDEASVMIVDSFLE